MYHIPEKYEDFDIELYFESVTDVYDLVDSRWPFLRSRVERTQLETLLGGIEKSLSLNRFEKMRVINSKLSGFQSSQLIEVFSDEAVEFKKLMDEEGESIFDLAVSAYNDWVEDLLPTLLRGPVDPDEDDKLELLNIMMFANYQEGTPEFL